MVLDVFHGIHEIQCESKLEKRFSSSLQFSLKTSVLGGERSGQCT